MKIWILTSLLFLAFLFRANQSFASEESNFPEYLQSISVVVSSISVNGSGVVFIRKDSTGTNDIAFIWTAGHVVSHTRNHFQEHWSKETVQRMGFHLREYKISQDVSKDGEAVGVTNAIADVVKFSDDDHEDIALLRVRGSFFVTNSVVFDLSSKAPKVGSHLFSVTAPYCRGGSFSEGVISFTGRKLNGHSFDQTTCTIYPGSSGGPIFSLDGKCVGLTDSMKAPNMNFIVPLRRIMKWAENENLEWALNPYIPIPSEEELRKIPSETDDEQENTVFLFRWPWE